MKILMVKNSRMLKRFVQLFLAGVEGHKGLSYFRNAEEDAVDGAIIQERIKAIKINQATRMQIKPRAIKIPMKIKFLRNLKMKMHRTRNQLPMLKTFLNLVGRYQRYLS